jgi:uncharacterized metal-binding protein (TIGR02443 family)
MRRFIAGAVCPQCRAVDRTVLEEREGGDRRRRCVSCGHAETLAADSAAEPAVRLQPPTRFSRRRSAAPAATPVRILDPAGKDPSDSG